LRIPARTPRAGRHKDLDVPAGQDAEEAESQQAAQLPHPRIPFSAAAARRDLNGQPDLVAGRGPVDALQHELESEAELQFADHDDRRCIPAERDEVAALDLAFDVESEGLKKALHRAIERGLQDISLR